MYCPNCGQKLKDRAKFCSRCGKKLAINEEIQKDKDISSVDWKSKIFSLPNGEIIVERYEIVSLLGKGSYGLVYQAKDNILNEKIVLKFLKPQFSQDTQVFKRFHREIQMIRKLNHPNIIRIFEIGYVAKMPFFTMEWIKNGDLRSHLKKYAILKLEDAISIMEQLASALKEAHNKGIIHRDLKPENILLDEKLNIKLTDFGLARMTESATLTRTGTLLGSPAYMSPEQVKGQRVDHRADLYALGIIFYEMLVGKQPFIDSNILNVMFKHLNDPIVYPKGFEKKIGKKTIKIIDKLLAKKPRNRYQSIDELLVDLKKAVATLSNKKISIELEESISASYIMTTKALSEAEGELRKLFTLKEQYLNFIASLRTDKLTLISGDSKSFNLKLLELSMEYLKDTLENEKIYIIHSNWHNKNLKKGKLLSYTSNDNNSFQEALQKAFKDDANIILIGLEEGFILPDNFARAITNRIVIVTLPAINIIEALENLFNQGLSRIDASSLIEMILHYHLIEKNCPHCSVHIQISPELKKNLFNTPLEEMINILPALKEYHLIGSLPIDSQERLGILGTILRLSMFSRSRGCSKCTGNGKPYISITQLIPFSETIREMLKTNKSLDEIFKQSYSEGNINLRQAAIVLALAGKISPHTAAEIQ